MNGAEALAHTLIDAGVDTFFAHPGTSEMHFAAALDRAAGMRCVPGLFEGVVTGAADGYYRMRQRPAGTLLHLGAGLTNGSANLHNARKARSGVVNIVGEHAASHLTLDAPLSSGIEGIARPVSHWVRAANSLEAIAPLGREAVLQARQRPAQIATLVLPADMAWSAVPAAPLPLGQLREAAPDSVDAAQVEAAARVLRDFGSRTLLLLGGRAVRARATAWAGRIAAATGCTVMSEFHVERIERGAGRTAIPRLPCGAAAAQDILARFEHIVLVCAAEPVSSFAHPRRPGRLARADTQFQVLCGHGQDPEEALHLLCEDMGGLGVAAATLKRAVSRPEDEDGNLTPEAIGRLLAGLIPEQAVVVDEAIPAGRAFDKATQHAAPHDWLTGMGASVGYGLPVAVGAALASPDRRVIALESDGSAMYTLQSLWTMARESLDVTVLVFADRRYRILRGEFPHVGAGEPGKRTIGMLGIDRPALDWVSLASGHGVPGCRVTRLGELADAMRRSFATEGPGLIELVL